MPISRYLFAILLPLLSGSALATAYEALEDIRAAAESEVWRQFDDPKLIVRVGRIDRRLKLRRCDEALSAEPGPGGVHLGRVSIAVRCDGVRPWSLYVPVSLSLRQRVVVAARPLVRGQILDAADLAYKERELKRASHAYFTEKQALIGRELTRRVAAGAALRANHTRRALAVKRGMRVAILSSLPGLRVSMGGKALDNGGIGERIRVRNSSSKRELDAIVLAPGKVRVAP